MCVRRRSGGRRRRLLRLRGLRRRDRGRLLAFQLPLLAAAQGRRRPLRPSRRPRAPRAATARPLAAAGAAIAGGGDFARRRLARAAPSWPLRRPFVSASCLRRCSESGFVPALPARIASCGSLMSGFCGAGSADFAAPAARDDVGSGASLMAGPRSVALSRSFRSLSPRSSRAARRRLAGIGRRDFSARLRLGRRSRGASRLGRRRGFRRRIGGGCRRRPRRWRAGFDGGASRRSATAASASSAPAAARRRGGASRLAERCRRRRCSHHAECVPGPAGAMQSSRRTRRRRRAVAARGGRLARLAAVDEGRDRCQLPRRSGWPAQSPSP